MSKKAIFFLLSLAFVGTVDTVNPLLLSQSSPAQRTFKEPDDDLDEFVGQVKKIDVEIEEHEFTTHFMDFGNRYKRKLFQTIQFDREGKKVEEYNYRIDGVPLPKTTYSYDKNGVLLKENHYSAVSGKPYLETIYVYDPQGVLKEKIGKDIEKDELLSRTLYSHDRKRSYTEVTKYDWNNVVQWKVGFNLNNQGKAIGIVALSQNGDILGRGTITYDTKGNIVEMVFHPSDGKAEKKGEYTYEFDKQGNWVKKTDYDWVTEEGKPFYKLMNITYRTIIYY